jgi:transcriptional regulator with XRE-family HTH domain
VSACRVFSDNLVRERKRLGLTQEQLWEASGIDRSEISRLERGLRDARLSTIERLAIGLGVPAARLLDGIPRKSRADSPCRLV